MYTVCESNANSKNWVANIKSVLHTLGMGDVSPKSQTNVIENSITLV